MYTERDQPAAATNQITVYTGRTGDLYTFYMQIVISAADEEIEKLEERMIRKSNVNKANMRNKRAGDRGSLRLLSVGVARGHGVSLSTGCRANER